MTSKFELQQSMKQQITYGTVIIQFDENSNEWTARLCLDQSIPSVAVASATGLTRSHALNSLLEVLDVMEDIFKNEEYYT